jgi:iron complex transport system permease protein
VTPSPTWFRSRRFGVVVLALFALLAFASSIGIGAAGLSLAEVLAALAGGGTPTDRSIVLELRLPRAIAGLLAGGSLALSGATFQALLRNPLAEPYVLGVSGGAAVGAVGAIVLGAGNTTALLPAFALIGALGSVLLVLRIALRVGRALDTRVLLLAGVIVGAFFNAVILLLLTLADVESFRSAIFWMMGSLASASWGGNALLAAYAFPASFVIIMMARPLNLLAAGEETALYLGIRVTRIKTIAYVTASMLVAATVAVCGTIGFIGLVIPHAMRMLWGGDHRFLLPAVFLAGGAFLLLADTGARIVAAPAELPVGVVTALIGVPLFVLLLRRSQA